MTAEQKAWLDSHRDQGYRVRGPAPGNCTWANTGMLHADGKFEPYVKGRPAVRPGSFEVGQLVVNAGNMPNPGF